MELISRDIEYLSPAAFRIYLMPPPPSPPPHPLPGFPLLFTRFLVRSWDYSRPIKFNEFPRVRTALLVSLITHTSPSRHGFSGTQARILQSPLSFLSHAARTVSCSSIAIWYLMMQTNHLVKPNCIRDYIWLYINYIWIRQICWLNIHFFNEIAKVLITSYYIDFNMQYNFN